MSDTPRPGLTARFAKGAMRGLRFLVRVTLTLVVVAGAAMAIRVGTLELQSRADAAELPPPAPTLPVAVTALPLQQGFSVPRGFVGQIEPQKTTQVSFELAGRLAAIYADEGDTVRAGQLLAQQDTALLVAEQDRLTASRDAVTAQLTFARQTLDRTTALQQDGFASQARVDEALARLDELSSRLAEIDAGLATVAIQIDKARVLAPFDGRISGRFVDGAESLGAGQSLLEIVEQAQPLVRVGVPLDLSETHLAQAQIDINGRSYAATLDRLRPDIDPVTRTRTALFSIKTDRPLTFGQTAVLTVEDQIDEQGLWVATTSLKEGQRGQWTLLVVDREQTVRRAPVEVIYAQSNRVFVRGTFPEGTLLIAEGPHRVTIGQRVDPQLKS